MTKIFDTYDLQARLSVVIMLITPVLLSLYLQIESIRSIASTAVITVVLLAISNLLIICVRYRGKGSYIKRDLVVEYLLPQNTKIEKPVKERLYKFLESKDSNFSILNNEKNSEEASVEYKDACRSALNWLKEHSRESNIVNKENAMYGFCRNLYASKSVGILISIFMIVLHFVQFEVQYDFELLTLTPEYIVSFLVAIIYLFVWLFVVKKELVEFCARNYAEALIRSFDKMIN